MKQRNLFMSLTLMCGFLALGFQFMPVGITWIWKNSPIVALILVMLSILFGVFWNRSHRLLNKK